MSGFFFIVAAICFIAAFAMGVTIKDIHNMVANGVFSFGPEDGFHIQILEDDEDSDSGNNHHSNNYDSDNGYMEREISHKCTKLYVELAAGKIDIYYDDVEYVQVRQKNVPKFSMTSSDVEESLHISGDLDVTENSGIELIIVLPRDVELEVVYLEVGASQLTLRDLMVDQFHFAVGAGQGEISNLSACDAQFEVGAGQAIVKNLSVQNLNVEVGLGQVDVEIAGAETDYNYDVDCGIGSVNVDNHSFGGMGTTQNITNDGANHHVKIDCGIGEVNMNFTCNITDGTCEDNTHHHSSHNK